ncbi:ATP-binding protein [Candidatus Poribacteria bacterium]|nr:ATP-binding protein [Candidatus Poribacteria bacterium]MYG07964.1 ATP-binding protein [Candidatus Poribacteria bacterium]MYK22919.1 ATP-binding protein [Candidatus Poribacteria bacterium]
MEKEKEEIQSRSFVGTLVGESTSKEFRLAVTPEAIREQDIIAVDAALNEIEDNGGSRKIRVWAKVQKIERINPFFPVEAGHELAETQTNPIETVLSLSREIVSAVCQVLGYELKGEESGKLESLRYPPKPATSAYRPNSEDLERVLVGNLAENQISVMDIATLSNRTNVDVKVDGHAIVTRHLAILAMTGAGKSWAARRIIEELANKNYPMLVFDPRGDYTGLADIEQLHDRVDRYYATFPIFEQDADTVVQIVNNLGYPLTDTMMTLFSDLFNATKRFYEGEGNERISWLTDRLDDRNANYIHQHEIQPDLWLIANIADAASRSIRDARDGNHENLEFLQQICWSSLPESTNPTTLEGICKRTRRAASQLRRMETVNQEIAGSAQPMPLDRAELVQDGKISIVSLAGYTGDFQATIYSIIAEELFEAKVTKKLKWPFLLLLEEAHNFVPGRATSVAEQQSIAITKQIAQEGRKFHMGLIVISQRPSRLDETTLSQCNSYIIMRMVNPADQTFVKRVVESLGEEEANLLPNLEVGEALLSGQMVNFPILVKMKEPESRGEREETNAFEYLKKVRTQTSNS